MKNDSAQWFLETCGFFFVTVIGQGLPCLPRFCSIFMPLNLFAKQYGMVKFIYTPILLSLANWFLCPFCALC